MKTKAFCQLQLRNVSINSIRIYKICDCFHPRKKKQKFDSTKKSSEMP